jgi:hypothetical protein
MLTFYSSIFIDRKLTIGLIIRYVSLNIIEIIIIIIIIVPKSNIFTDTGTQDSSRVCDVVPEISSPKQTILFAPFFYRA